MYTENELSEKLVGELKTMATKLKIDNLENLTKKEIIDLIITTVSPKNADEAPKKRGRKPKVTVKVEDDPLLENSNHFLIREKLRKIMLSKPNWSSIS